MNRPTISIPPATSADCDALVALEALCFTYSQIGKRSFQRLLRSSSAAIHLAFIDEQLAGYSLLLSRSNSRRWRLYSLATAPFSRGQGVARQLLLKARDVAAAAGANKLSLEVKCDNKAAIALYQDVGFETVDLLIGYYDDGSDGLKMVLSL